MLSSACVNRRETDTYVEGPGADASAGSGLAVVVAVTAMWNGCTDFAASRERKLDVCQ
jgi:hypothetical protein